MTSPDPDLVRRAATRLAAGVDAPNMQLADRRFFRMVRWGARSPRNTDALFAAVQMLRDLGTIDNCEAAYLFNELRDHLLWKQMTGNGADPRLEQAIREGTEHDLLLAAMADEERARTAAWYRERGEEEIADMIANDHEQHDALCTEGYDSLLEDKPTFEPPAPPAESAGASRRLAERVLALSATETMAEWHAAWMDLCSAMNDTPPAIAVPAIRGLRDVGGISFEESLVLIDMAIEDEVQGVLAADRQYQHLQRELEAVEQSTGIVCAEPAAGDPGPIAWQIVRHRLARRIIGQTAVVLRRFGEHRLANLLVAKPGEYARIRDDSRIGAA